MITPIESISNRTIGYIETVSPSSFSVSLDTKSPHSVSINTGVPRPFPRLNGYLIIPNEKGAVVGIITWLGIEETGYSKFHRSHDKDLIDLPFPKRKLTLIPVGNMTLEECKGKSGSTFNLERGVSVYPSVGDAVILPTKDELACIVEGRDENARLKIGTAQLAGGVHVSVDPDKLFGRHLAVLGNTGSGKSCSIAGLIRWSLKAAYNKSSKTPNARFIILDPNGEYSKAFDDVKDFANCRVLSLSSRDTEGLKLSAPHWAWSTALHAMGLGSIGLTTHILQFRLWKSSKLLLISLIKKLLKLNN